MAYYAPRGAPRASPRAASASARTPSTARTTAGSRRAAGPRVPEAALAALAGAASPVAAQPEEIVAQRAAQKAAAADAAAKAAEDARRKAERAAEKVAEKRAEKQFDDMMSGKGYANVSPSTLAGPVGSADVKRSERVDKLRNFAMTPLELKSELDAMVIGQDNAKKALSVAFCEHFHHARRCIEEPDR